MRSDSLAALQSCELESGVYNSEIEWLCFEAYNLFALNKI